MLVPWGWAKRAPINFGETRLSERKPLSKFIWVQKANGNESDIHMFMLMQWGWAKQAPINFGETRPGKVNAGQILFRSGRPRETNPIWMLVPWGWAKRAPIDFGWIRPRESEPRSKFVWVRKAREMNPIYTAYHKISGNITTPNCSFIYICWFREAEQNKPQ